MSITDQLRKRLEGKLVVQLSSAAIALDCSTDRIRKLIANGELESFLDGKVRKVTTDSLIDYVVEHVEGEQPTPRQHGNLVQNRRTRLKEDD